jgi:prepilin-type N-terminal cleavage/methylation domain-containing protein
MGFTLIELLVVVMIIGILAAVAVPQYFKVVEKSRIAEASGYIGEYNSAQGRYYARFTNYYSDSVGQAGGDGPEGSLPALQYWQPSNGASGSSLTLTLTRNGPGGVGTYSMVSTATNGGSYTVNCVGTFCTTVCGSTNCPP